MATYLIDFSLVSFTIFMLGSHSLIDTWELTTELLPSTKVFWGHLKKWYIFCQLFYFNKLYYSVQFSHSVVSESLRPHESQHARPPCPSPTPGVHSDSRPSSRWCHPAISSSVVPFSSCPQSLPASESFSMSQLFAGGGQSIGTSASTSVLPMNTQDWSPLG